MALAARSLARLDCLTTTSSASTPRDVATLKPSNQLDSQIATTVLAVHVWQRRESLFPCQLSKRVGLYIGLTRSESVITI